MTTRAWPHLQARNHGGGGEGGLSPPWKNLSPPMLPVPFAVTIGIEVYPPPGILSDPPVNDTWLRRWPHPQCLHAVVPDLSSLEYRGCFRVTLPSLSWNPFFWYISWFLYSSVITTDNHTAHASDGKQSQS